ncbi:MAG: hypothetical protein VYC34_02275 [Planctomycetota bacterium]|nr:hypothetical protein [Planctomycetota bacterium]
MRHAIRISLLTAASMMTLGFSADSFAANQRVVVGEDRGGGPQGSLPSHVLFIDSPSNNISADIEFPSGGGISDLEALSNGDVLVRIASPARVFRASPSTGTLEEFLPASTWNPEFGSPLAIGIDQSESLIVGTRKLVAPGMPTGQLARVDRESGATEVLVSDPRLERTLDIAVAPNGVIYLTTIIDDVLNIGGLYSFDPITTDLSLIASGGLLTEPTGLTVVSETEVLVASGRVIVSIDTQTGTSTTLFDDPNSASLFDVTYDSKSNDIYFTGEIFFGGEGVFRFQRGDQPTLFAPLGNGGHSVGGITLTIPASPTMLGFAAMLLPTILRRPKRC